MNNITKLQTLVAQLKVLIDNRKDITVKCQEIKDLLDVMLKTI